MAARKKLSTRRSTSPAPVHGGSGVKPLAEAQIHCCGHLHTIVLKPCGRLSIVDPDGEVARQHAMAQLAGETPGCAKVYCDWRDAVIGAYSMSEPAFIFREAAREAYKLHCTRETLKNEQPKDARSRFTETAEYLLHGAVADLNNNDDYRLEDGTPISITAFAEPERLSTLQNVWSSASISQMGMSSLVIKVYYNSYLQLRRAMKLPTFYGPNALIFENADKARLPLALAADTRRKPADGSLFVLAGCQDQKSLITLKVAEIEQCDDDNEWIIKRWLETAT